MLVHLGLASAAHMDMQFTFTDYLKVNTRAVSITLVIVSLHTENNIQIMRHMKAIGIANIFR